MKSVREASDQVSAAGLLHAAVGAKRLGTTHVRAKRIVRYYLIYSINFYVLYYCVVEIYAQIGVQSWCGGRLSVTLVGYVFKIKLSRNLCWNGTTRLG